MDTILGIKVRKHSRVFPYINITISTKKLNEFQHLKVKVLSTLFDSNSKLYENSGSLIA